MQPHYMQCLHCRHTLEYVTRMQSSTYQVMNWSQTNYMNINDKKTKEIPMGSLTTSNALKPIN